LLRRNERTRAGAFLVEGPIPVAEALARGEVKDLFVDANEATASSWLARGAIAVSSQVIEALTDTSTPQGVVAIASMRTVPITEVTGDLVLVLSDVRDPGNAGTLVRSAVAAGATAVVFCTGSVDPFNPKTVRATAGLLFHVEVITGAALEAVVEELRSRDFLILGADAGSSKAPDEMDLRAPVALVLGNESWGIEESSSHLLDDTVGIPMPGPAESLNVGIAGSILLFEAVRQRRASSASRNPNSTAGVYPQPSDDR
jgi:RNA methyltransferase, TrmH family